MSLEEKTALLHDRLQSLGRFPFSDLFRDARTRMEVIVTFMALLELIKGGMLRVHQTDSHGELWMFSNDVSRSTHAGPAAAAETAPAQPASEAAASTPVASPSGTSQPVASGPKTHESDTIDPTPRVGDSSTVEGEA